MRVVVEIVSGPSVGRTLEVGAGQVGLVGRASWAQLSLPKDLSIAGQHFNIECQASGAVLRVLNRQSPVYLNGIKLGLANLNDGDEIKAGENTFRVRVLADDGSALPAAPPPAAAPQATERRPVERPRPKPAPAPPKKGPTPTPDLARLLRRAQPLFALLDAARDERILELIRESGEEHQSLYEGYAAEELGHVSPYLVRLPEPSELLDVLVREAWGSSWGVFLTSHASFAEVRKHFRHFLMVESAGEEYLFRFYDPRVLRVFLPVCNAEETRQFFGPVDQYLLEAKEPGLLLRYSATPRGVKEDLEFLVAV